MSAIMEHQASNVQVLKENGGSIQTILSRTIRLNENSTLEREFITIVDPSLPLLLTGGTGVNTIYKSGDDYSSAGYMYNATYSLKASEDIRAFRLHFLTFDIWGNHVRTLCATDISDISAGTQLQRNGQWTLYDENEACEHYASICYISLVRTAAGVVMEGCRQAAMAEAQRFSSKFKDEDLDPRKTVPR